MLKWFSNDDAAPGQGAMASQEGPSNQSLAEVTEQLVQTQQLVTQLKELIREKDGILHTKDEQLQAEKDTSEAKLSKMRLQNRAKVTSLNSQLEELKKQLKLSGGKEAKPEGKKGVADGDQEHAAASRGKILLLRKKVEELEQQLSQREAELAVKAKELEAQHQRGAEMDAMLAEKVAFITDLQTSIGKESSPGTRPEPVEEQKSQPAEEGTSLQELQLLVQSLTKKVGESEEKCSLLQEQTESLKELLLKEKAQFEEKENMYKQNIQTFKDIILQKDNKLIEINQMHEQELFKLAAKSDASADLEQLLKALKQKLHEKEEVLLGKTQVIDVLQGEVDSRDQQIKELADRAKRAQSERDNLQSKLEAEKHVMRAQLRDLMQKHESELRRVAEKHESELSEKEQVLRRQMEERQRALVSTQVPAADSPVNMETAPKQPDLEAQVKLKTEEASKSEAKFLKMKAWSKSRIKQLEDELRKAQSESASPDVNALQSRVIDLEEEREEILFKLDQYNELKTKNDQLMAKLVIYEEQQRKMQADLEQVTKRAASQTSESGSADDLQSQVLEWQEMALDSESSRDQAREEKAVMALRLSHVEEEREALASRQQEMEEELAQARGFRQQKGKKSGMAAPRSLQEDFEFDGKHSYQDPKSHSESTSATEGENMGGLRSVVEELELERNQLQEQILGLEDRCQDLVDRLQLQARIESLQSETERLQGQLASLRGQHSRDAENHQLLVASLNEQLKGLSETQECLETSLIEKEQTLAKTSEKLEIIGSLKDSLKEKETQHKEAAEKLLHAEHNLLEVTKRCNTFEKQCSDQKKSVTELTQKLTVLKDKTQKQEATIQSLQTDLEQTNDELDKLNSTHLEERAQLIHDLQSCEREIDNLKDVLSDKDKEMSVLSSNMAEYTEQILVLKQEIRHKEEDLVRIEATLTKAEREAQIARESQSYDQQALNAKLSELTEQLQTVAYELNETQKQKDSKAGEVSELMKQVQEDNQTIQNLRGEIQKLTVGHRTHLLECQSQISSLKELATVSSQKSQESEVLLSQLKESNNANEKLKDLLQHKEQTYEKDLKAIKEERNQLLSEAAKRNVELQALSKRLEDQTEDQERIQRVMGENMESISLLEKRLKDTQIEAEAERLKLSQEMRAKESDNERLEIALQGLSENISKLEMDLTSTSNANQQLQADIENKEKEFVKQRQLVDDLYKKNEVALEQNANLHSQVTLLTEESQKLRQEVIEKEKFNSELIEDRNALQSKLATSEKQRLENQKITEGLLKEKEELSLRMEELNEAMKQNSKSVSESLLEKTNECNHLTKLLSESKETAAHLLGQVGLLNAEMEQLKCSLAEKEKIIVDQNAQSEIQQSQLVQLQETLSLHQEQGTALKSGLMEKDTLLQQKAIELSSLQIEILQQKELCTQLQTDTESLRSQCLQLNQSLEEKEVSLGNKTEECKNYLDELNKKNESVFLLRNQLDEINKNAQMLESVNVEMKAALERHVAVNDTLQEQVTFNQTEIAHLQTQILALNEENQQMRGTVENLTKDLAEQQNIFADLDKKTVVILETNAILQSQVSELTEEKQKLQHEVTEKDKSQSELSEERNLLQNKLSAYEIQHSENRKIIEVEVKEKAELAARLEELNQLLDQNRSSISESLQEKTNECSNLTKLLAESKETTAHLHGQVCLLNDEVERLKCSLTEKEKNIVDQNAQSEIQQSQLVQLQETVSLLQEQGTALKSGLMEKDTLLQQKAIELSSLQTEILQHIELCTQLKRDTDSLTSQCLQLSQSMEEKELTLRNKTEECKNYLDELNRRSEAVNSLNRQLIEMNENALKQKSNDENTKNTLDKQMAENDELREELSQRQATVVELQNCIKLLNEENYQLKTEQQTCVAELSQKVEELGVFRSELSNKDHEVLSLKEQFAAVQLERENLHMTLKQKSETMDQQETFIKQLQSSSLEGESQISQKIEIITKLQTQVETMQKSLQDRERSLQQKETELAELKDKVNTECEVLKNQITANMEVISHLQSELQSTSEKNRLLNMEIDEKESQFKQKEDDYLNLKARFSELEDSAMRLVNQLDVVTLESSQLKETLKEKERAIEEIQNSSLTFNEVSTVTLKTKETECQSLKEQVSMLQESVSKLTDNLSSKSSEIAKGKKVLEEKEDELLDQLKVIQDLQRKVDELALFKTQFMESTELISELQSQIQGLSSESRRLGELVDEKQSAFLNLQEKYASHLEELSEVKKLLSQKNEEVTNLSQVVREHKYAVTAAENTVDLLRNENALITDKLQQSQASVANLSKQKEDAVVSHQMNASTLTVEIERLKSQHLQVAAQITSLTENLEQRELALHAINAQYTAQVKHAENLVSDMHKLEEQNKRLREEISLSTQQLEVAISEKMHLQQEIKKKILEKEEADRSHNDQLQVLKDKLQLQHQQHFGNLSEAMEKMTTEKEHLQAQVSAKVEEINGFKLEIQKMTQTLQESEKEWLSVLDRESQERKLLNEQLRSAENEMKSKDIKVQALKHDLDELQQKFVEVMATLQVSSEQIQKKDREALKLRQQFSENSTQLQEILLAVQKKEKENLELIQTLKDKENEMSILVSNKQSCDKDLQELTQNMSDRLIAFEEEKYSLQTTIKRLKESYESEVDSLKKESDDMAWLLQQKQDERQISSQQLREADVNQASLLSEVQKKDDTINCLNIQLSQQKELLAALSQQLKEKDASVAQVMVSASNTMVKHTEEKNQLVFQLESLQSVHSCSLKELENVSLQLEESKAQLSACQGLIETKDLEKVVLVKEKEELKIQQDKLCREKDVMKKKLQAALVVRKDLLKKIEKYEQQIEENKNHTLEISALQEKIQELTTRAESTISDHEAQIDLLKQQMVKKDEEISGKDFILEKLTENMQCLQKKFDEQEEKLTATFESLTEKCEVINHLQVGITAQEEAFDRERCEMMMNMDLLKEEKVKREESFKVEMAAPQTGSLDMEQELSKVKQEKEILLKKVHAALLARKETIKRSQENARRHTEELSGLKEEFGKLLEQHSQQKNDLNAIQIKYDEMSKELEDIQCANISLKDELDTAGRLINEKDERLHGLSMSLTEKEELAEATSLDQRELENLRYKLENMTYEMTKKDALLVALEQRSKELAAQVEHAETELEKTYLEMREKNGQIMRQQQEMNAALQQYQHDKQAITEENMELQHKFKESQEETEDLKRTLGAIKIDYKSQYEELSKINKTLLEANAQIKEELENALSVITQKSLELQSVQNILSECQVQFGQEREHFKTEIEKLQACAIEAQAEVESYKLCMETLQKEKENASVVLESCKTEVANLKSELGESVKLKDELFEKIHELEEKEKHKFVTGNEELQSLKSFTEELKVSLKERDDALVSSKTAIIDKDELIAALEQQLQKEIHLHEVAMEQMKTVVNGLQQKGKEGQGDESKTNDQIARKLQAALISRKEALKENRSLKEQIQALRSENEDIQNSSFSLDRSFAQLRQHKEDLESSVSSLSKEKEKLISEVDRILSDNHNLSAACESLKLTIENITQQKQAFSCQLESLKDSQTVELSDWKSKHTELKHEYESLLQAYENVSCEMDKMRQLLEVTRKEKQDVLLRAIQTESVMENLEKQLTEAEKEKEKNKEKMRKFTKSKQQKMQDLEMENENIRKDMLEFDLKHKYAIEDLTKKNDQLEEEMSCLKAYSEELRVKFNEMQTDNSNLTKELKLSKTSLENWSSESKASENNLQLKLDETLNLNGVLTADIEAKNAEIVAKQETIDFMQIEKLNLSEQLTQLKEAHKVQFEECKNTMAELQGIINRKILETDSLGEKVRILGDDKCLLQEELENVQETSEKVKNENEYLETMLLKNAGRIDELTEALSVLQAQNTKLSTQLTDSKEERDHFCRAKEEQHLKLVREFEEKLKVAQRGNEGSKNMKRELQELLKEKHQEINQLQHDCIKYQELILELERSLKDTRSEAELAEKECKGIKEKVSGLEERTMHLETELMSYKKILKEARKEVEDINSERDQLKQELAKRDQESKCQLMQQEKALESKMEQEKAHHKGKLLEFQNQINELQGLKAKSSQVVIELRRQLDSKDLEMKTVKEEAETNMAKLAALSANPQSDDITKQWDEIFQKTLQEKDRQLLEQGYIIMKLLEDLRDKDKLVNELQVTSLRLERSLNDYTVATTAQQRQLFVMGASNTELNQNLELLNRQIKEQSVQVKTLEHDKSLLKTQLEDKEVSLSQTQSSLKELDKMLSDSQSQFLLVQAQNDKVQVDLQKQEAISMQMKTLLVNKDSEISLLLSSRDGQMSEYLEQLQKHHRAQIVSCEDRLTSMYSDKEIAGKAFRELESKIKSLHVKYERSVQEKEQLVTKLEIFKNSMTSLQMDRERLMSECKVLETQLLSVARDKESLVKEDQSESKGLKQEIKTVLYQMDDLNSENAMLKAQLIRYREDLNQVLSMKDNQLKELLKKQQDSIKNLSNQKTDTEKQLREALVDLQKEVEMNNAVRTKNSKLASLVQELEANLLTLKKEKAAMNESKVIADLQVAVASKAAECNDLHQKLLAQKMAIDDLKISLQQLEKETEKKLGEAEDKYNGELSAFEREVDLMRNERETADNRVAELARDLMETEQQLSEVKSQSMDMKSKNESLGKAMAALQNDRDLLIEDFKVLRNRYDRELREATAAVTKLERQLGDASSEMSSLTKERYILIQKLSAFESDNAHSQLTGQIDELCRVVSEKEAELKRLLQENDRYSKQMAAFSGSMASLQDDRDRLIQELASTKRVFESSPTATTPVKSEDLNSLRSSLDALPTQNNRLLKEVEDLRSENSELTQLRLRSDELQKALQQAQNYRRQAQMDIGAYQAELAELRSEKNLLLSECHALKEQHLVAVTERDRQVGELQKLSSESQIKEVRSPDSIYPVKESVALLGKGVSSEQVGLLLAERDQLQADLQRCLQDLHQRDLRFQQVNAKLLQTVEEKMALSSQLKGVSQALRDSQLSLGELQNRCYWLESQGQTRPGQPYHDHAPEGESVEVPPGAPQERTNTVVDVDGPQASELRSRLAEAELQLDSTQQDLTQLTESLAEERARREAAEEALGLVEERIKSVPRTCPRDFSIQLESDDEREALIIDPTEHVVIRKMKGGVLSCKRWLRGRSLYCSKLLTSRAKSRYLFLAYLLALHIVVFMCLTGAL